LKRGTALKALHVERNAAELADGSEIAYEKILLATGAAPAIPPIPGLDQVAYHVLRTLDDATKLNAAIRKLETGRGAGRRSGRHACRREPGQGRRLGHHRRNGQATDRRLLRCDSGRLDREGLHRQWRPDTDRQSGGQTCAVQRKTGALLTLENGTTLEADLLLVATGVKPNMEYLAGSQVEHDRGILVSDTMQTSVANVWSAGDCAQARGFFTDAKVMNAILPDATEQGRIAGMAMAGDPGAKPYPGGVPLNTYHFFGRHAISVGSSKVPDGGEMVTRFDEASGRYLKAIFTADNRLTGIYGVNEFFDGGVMCQLILRRVDLTPVKERFLANPLAVGRELMSKLWR
jgi:phenylglyoxylate dehydrogenase epsilon subunit